MDQKKTGSFLRELRKNKGLTQEQAAERFNTSSRTISRWETGAYMPDISMLVEIAEFYEVDVREIIDGERKNDNMNSEVKEVAVKMADYSETEKNRTLKWIRIISFVALILSFLQLAGECLVVYMMNELFGEVFAQWGLAFSGSFIVFAALVVMTFYTNGRIKDKGSKILPVITLILVILAILAMSGTVLTMCFASKFMNIF
jgi:transcriptional regulator with XRE-family HTH domain